MASTKESNTSKTAHVMNLLSRTRGSASPAAETVETPEGTQTPAAPAAPAASPQMPPILSSMEADAAVSTQIKDALEDALASAVEEEPVKSAEPVRSTVTPAASEAPPAPAVQWPELESGAGKAPPAESQPPVQQEPVSQPAPSPVQQEPAPQPAPSPVQQEPAPQADAAVLVPEPPVSPEVWEAQAAKQPDISYINVMELLVEERAGKYMEMFGMCQCERCKVDVKALALNGLPSKYVVMGREEFVPKITVYEGHFSAAIIAQLLRACKIVMASPHHGPKRDL